ncbi:hypothetical protein [Cognatiluteimonas weifangensis]|nr:hypothetical protein [Luteimonas weifangensis]
MPPAPATLPPRTTRCARVHLNKAAERDCMKVDPACTAGVAAALEKLAD